MASDAEFESTYKIFRLGRWPTFRAHKSILEVWIIHGRSLVAINRDCFEKRPVALALEDLDTGSQVCLLSTKIKTFL